MDKRASEEAVWGGRECIIAREFKRQLADLGLCMFLCTLRENACWRLGLGVSV